jgi:hypothetical protein
MFRVLLVLLFAANVSIGIGLARGSQGQAASEQKGKATAVVKS